MDKNKQEEKRFQIEKNAIDVISSTDSIDEIWKESEVLFGGSLLWEHVENLYKKGSKKIAISILCNVNAQAMHKPMDNSNLSAINSLVKKMQDNFKSKDHHSVALDLFMIAIKNILEVNGVKIPKNIEDLDCDNFGQNISEDMLLPFAIFQILAMGRVGEKINNMKESELEKLFALLIVVWSDISGMIMIESILKHKNSKRKKQIGEFFNEHSKVEDELYDLMETEMSEDEAEKEFLKLTEKDPECFDAYQELINIYDNQRKYGELESLLFTGAQLALNKIVDYQGRWPKHIMWAHLENRPLVKMLDRFAYYLWEKEKFGYSLDMYRKLLISNPNDNIGARYNILSILMDYDPGEVEDMFPASQHGFVDAIKINNWFDKNAHDFPEEFNWWFDFIKENE